MIPWTQTQRFLEEFLLLLWTTTTETLGFSGRNSAPIENERRDEA